MKRMYLMIAIGMYTGFRISDIVRLKVSDVRGSELTLTEQKTGKQRTVPIHRELRKIVSERLKGKQDDEYIFASRKRDRKGNVQPISTRCAGFDCKIIEKQFGLTSFSCHSTRKTFAMAIYNKPPSQGGKDIARVASALNHSDTAITMRYLGLTQKLINQDVNAIDFDFTADGKTGRGRPRKTENW